MALSSFAVLLLAAQYFNRAGARAPRHPAPSFCTGNYLNIYRRGASNARHKGRTTPTPRRGGFAYFHLENWKFPFHPALFTRARRRERRPLGKVIDLFIGPWFISRLVLTPRWFSPCKKGHHRSCSRARTCQRAGEENSTGARCWRGDAGLGIDYLRVSLTAPRPEITHVINFTHRSHYLCGVEINTNTLQFQRFWYFQKHPRKTMWSSEQAQLQFYNFASLFFVYTKNISVDAGIQINSKPAKLFSFLILNTRIVFAKCT